MSLVSITGTGYHRRGQSPAAPGGGGSGDALLLGVGGVTDGAATYRVDAGEAATVQIRHSTASDLSGATTSTGVAVDSSTNYTGGESISGLSANTTYYYDILKDGVSVFSAPYPTFKTFPAAGVDATVKIAFGSCMNSPVETALWATLAAENPNLLLHLGDFHYGNTTDLALQRTSHQAMFTADYYTHVVKKMATAHTWDDHEFGGNNEDGDLAGKANSLQAFKEYRPTYTLVNPTNGVWQSFPLANSEFFVIDPRYLRQGGGGNQWPSSLDATPDGTSSGATIVVAGDGTRQFNDAFKGWYYRNTNNVVERVVTSVWNSGTSKHTVTLTRSVTSGSSLHFYFVNKSMLDFTVLASNNQVDWLVNGINASTKRWKILATPVIWNPTFVNDDSWYGYSTERLYIAQHITATNVLVVSGDRHRCAIDTGANSGYPECSASPFNETQASLNGSWDRGFTTIGENYFGLLTLTAADATFTIKNRNGTVPVAITPLTVPTA